MPLMYRRWKESDLPAIQQLLLNTWMETYSSFIPKTDLKFYHNATYNLGALKEMFLDPAINGFVAELDRTVVGFARTKLAVEENRFYVSSIYIESDHQGKGIGRALLVTAAKEAHKLKLDKIWIGVMEKNVDALTWYRKYGYQIVEEAPFAMGNTTVNHYIGYVPVTSLIPS
jgi:ribosomal protein S18 acetylase RimI-like enzyme